MRRASYAAAAALLAAFAAPASGQDLLSTCEGLAPGDIEVRNVSPVGQPFVENARAAAIDQVRFLCSQVAMTLSNVQPSVGVTFSGGNPVLGTAANIGTRFGGLPRFSITGRVNASLTELPDLFDENFRAAISETQGDLPPVETTLMPLAALQADAAVGLFDGISLAPALGGLGAVDVLGSIAFIPVLESVGINEVIWNWGLGARVGILGGGLVAPAVSVSGMYRRMGEVQFGDIENDGDAGQFATDLSVLSLRAAISKGLLAFDFTAGAGYDRYTSDPSFNFLLECQTQECTLAANPGQPLVLTMADDISGDLETSAWNVFGNVALNMFLLNLVGEVGYQVPIDVIEAGDLEDGRPLTEEELNGGRFFGSVGLRVAI